MVAYWLFKSEPNVFSLNDLKAGPTDWSGVRNYQARNYMQSMQIADLGFFYHSNAEPPGIVGTVEVVRTSYPDHTALDPESAYYDPRAITTNPWQAVDIAFQSAFKSMVSLAQLRSTPGLEDMPLLRRGNRLSVLPVTPQQWQIICTIAG